MYVHVGQERRELPCDERRGELLRIQRCPAGTALFEPPSWREQLHGRVDHDRMLSIGIELASVDRPALAPWRDQLLESGSVDLIYRIAASDAQLSALRQDLGPMLSHTQVAWWSGDELDAAARERVEEQLRDFDRSLYLGSGEVEGAWLVALQELFRTAPPGPLREAAIRGALGREAIGEAPRGLTWIVPEAQVGEPATPAPRPAWEPPMVAVPAGPFLMGSSAADPMAKDNERPQHSLTLPDYWIGQTEVTNAQFRPFVEGDGYRNRDYWTADGWAWKEELGRTQPDYWNDAEWNGDQQPVVGVSWYEAVAYVRWLSAQTGHPFRLPSEAEWEKAARGSDGRIWPWGNSWAEGLANTSEAGVGGSMPVGSYPAGASPYGALDMAGNVWEWCATAWGKGYPYVVEDEWAASYLEQDERRVIRGGSWFLGQRFARGAYRSYHDARDNDHYSVGMRVASSSPRR